MAPPEEHLGGRVTPANTSPGARCVLVIEADPGQRTALVHALASRLPTLDTLEAESAAAAMGLLAERQVDCVLASYDLPGGGALALLECLRAPSGLTSVPVVVLTGGAGEGPGLEAIRAGAQDYLLVQQVSPRLLERALRYAVERHRLARDLQEREERARRAQRMEALGRLAGEIAHDFNNMLTAITGFSERALHKLDTLHPARRDVEQVARAAERSAELTQRILTYSRSRPRLARVLDVGQLVQDLWPLLDTLSGSRVALELVAEPGCLVRADPGQIEQVVVNLVLNARDAMPDGGRVGVHVASGERDVRLRVTDAGVGMDSETLAHLFEPFFTSKPRGEGTGLGLAVVQGIVEESGGRIEVASQPGQGSTFEVLLPAVTPPCNGAGAAGC